MAAFIDDVMNISRCQHVIHESSEIGQLIQKTISQWKITEKLWRDLIIQKKSPLKKKWLQMCIFVFSCPLSWTFFLTSPLSFHVSLSSHVCVSLSLHLYLSLFSHVCLSSSPSQPPLISLYLSSSLYLSLVSFTTLFFFSLALSFLFKALFS